MSVLCLSQPRLEKKLGPDVVMQVTQGLIHPCLMISQLTLVPMMVLAQLPHPQIWQLDAISVCHNPKILGARFEILG